MQEHSTATATSITTTMTGPHIATAMRRLVGIRRPTHPLLIERPRSLFSKKKLTDWLIMGPSVRYRLGREKVADDAAAARGARSLAPLRETGTSLR
jgi:hypothetical protein